MRYYDVSVEDALKQLGIDLAVGLLLVTLPIWGPLLEFGIGAWRWANSVVVKSG